MTLEEIKTESGKDEGLKKGILTTFKEDFIKGAEAEGMVVRTKEQDKQFLDRHVAEILPGKVDEKFESKFKESLDAIDADVLTLTSIPKGPHEKTTEYAKRALKEFNAKGGDPVTKQKVEQLEKMVQDTKAEYEKKLGDKESQLFTKEIEWQVNGALDKKNIAVPVHLKTDEEKQAYINQQRSLIKQGFITGVQPKRDNEGTIVFYDGDKPLMSQKDGKPLSAGEIIDSKFSAWFVPTQHTVTGTGTGQNGNGQGSVNGAFKNKDDIHKHLASQGMDAATKEYYDEFSKLATENKIAI